MNEDKVDVNQEPATAAPWTELQASLRQTLEEWWNEHIHQSPAAKDPRIWDHLVNAFEELKKMLLVRFR